MQTLLSEFSGGSTIGIQLYEPKATGVELVSAAFLPGAEGHDLVIPEGGSATFGVRLSERPTTTVTVNLGKLVAQQFDGNLNAVTVSPTTLTFTPDNYGVAQTVTVTGVRDDDGDHEHVIVSVQRASGRFWADGVYVTVTDSGAAAQIGIQPTRGRESGDGTANNIPITFWLSQASTSTVTVRYRTVDGTATAGSDYTAASGTVTFAPGETRKTVNISIIDDSVEDSGETFFVELSNPSNASITPGYTRARVEILNDETGEFSVTITDNSDGGGGGSGGGTPTPTNNNDNGGNSGSDGGGSSGGGSSGGGGGGSSRPAPSSRAALSGLYATPRDEDGNPGKNLALSPAFTPGTTSYTLDVPYTTATLDIAPGLTSGTAAVGVRRDHGDLARAGVESGAGLAWQGDRLSLSARTRLFRTALDTEWGIGAALDYRHPRGTFVTLSPSYGNARDSVGQLWNGGLPRANDLSRADGLPRADGYAPVTPRKQLRADLRAGFTWQAPRRLGLFEPFVEARLQRRPSLRLGTHWTAPGGLTLRLAAARRGGAAGLPADNALLLEAGWRPGR